MIKKSRECVFTIFMSKGKNGCPLLLVFQIFFLFPSKSKKYLFRNKMSKLIMKNNPFRIFTQLLVQNVTQIWTRCSWHALLLVILRAKILFEVAVCPSHAPVGVRAQTGKFVMKTTFASQSHNVPFVMVRIMLRVYFELLKRKLSFFCIQTTKSVKVIKLF